MTATDLTPTDLSDASPCRICLWPETVDAGATLTLSTLLDAAYDPTGFDLVYRDASGGEMGRTVFSEQEDGSWTTGDIALAAPADPGTHHWTAVLVPTEAAGEPEEEIVLSTVEVPVRAHVMSVVVWDIPPAISRGEAFAVRVGLKCTGGCCSAGWGFRVRDHEGREVALGQVGDAPWEGTTALHHAVVTLSAPETEGQFAWTIEADTPEGTPPHGTGATPFRVTTVPATEFRLSIEAFDAATGAPVRRAKVVAHPFRTMTDEDGQAEILLPRGSYAVFVSGKTYFPFKAEGEMTGDVTIRAELHVDREFSDADAWS
jgi:hypothetical protein